MFFWKIKNVSVLCLVLNFGFKQGFQWPIAFRNRRSIFLTFLSLSSASVFISKTVRVPIDTVEQRNDYLRSKTVFLSSQPSLIKNEASLKMSLQREFLYCSFWGNRLMFLENQKCLFSMPRKKIRSKTSISRIYQITKIRKILLICFISDIHFIFHQQDCWGSYWNSCTLKRLSKLQKSFHLYHFSPIKDEATSKMFPEDEFPYVFLKKAVGVSGNFFQLKNKFNHFLLEFLFSSFPKNTSDFLITQLRFAKGSKRGVCGEFLEETGA